MLLLNLPRSSKSSWISSSKIWYWFEKTKTLILEIRGHCTRSKISVTWSMILSKLSVTTTTFMHYNSQMYCLSLARLAGALGPSSSSRHNRILTSATERAKQRLQIWEHNWLSSFSTQPVSIVGHGRCRRRSRNALYLVCIFGNAISTDIPKLVEISFIKLKNRTN